MTTDWALAVEALDDGLVVFGPDDRVAACNSAAARLLGIKPGTLVGLSGTTLGLPEVGMVPGRQGTGWLRVATAALADGARVVSLTDVTIERERELELRRVAELDELTGLPDRRHFLRLLARHIDSQRAEDVGGALLVLELDTRLSDRVLVRAAESLRERLRTDDVLGRVGAGTFAMLLPRTGPGDAGLVAEFLADGLVPNAHVQVWALEGEADAEAVLRSATAGA